MWPRTLRAGDWRQRYLDYVNARVLDAVRAARPDIFLCVKGVQLRPETIRAIGRLGVTTAGYWIDDPLDHARSLVNAPSYDRYFTNDAASVERYRREGITRIGHLQSAADPEVFFPLPDVRDTADVVFVGTHSPERRERAGGPPGVRHARLRERSVARGPDRPVARASRRFRGSDERGVQPRADQSECAPVVWTRDRHEPPALRGAGVARVPAHGLGGGDRRRLSAGRARGLLAERWGELREKVAYYLAHEDERRAIAARGHEHFLRHHTYAVRARELLEHLR